MTDANEALRALDNALDLASQVDGWASFPREPLEKALAAMDVIRANLTDPAYVRMPVEQTAEMKHAFEYSLGGSTGSYFDLEDGDGDEAYRAMLSATTKETSHD